MPCLAKNKNKKDVAVMFDVVCIGILVADVIAKPVNGIPARGLLSLTDEISLHSGGCAMSAAVDMSIIGLNTAIAGKIGNDRFGKFLKERLIEKGVNVEALAVDDIKQTSASIVLSDSGGERTFLHCAGANATFSEKDINWNVIDKSEIVFVAGAMLMDAFDGRDCAAVLKRCKEKGKLTVLDTAWDSKGRWMGVLEGCMPYIDVFLPSYDEAVQLSGKSDLKEISDVFFDKGVGKVAIKLGSKGCYLREGRESEGIKLSAYDTVVVDTTGAGDSFCAGFITGLSKGMSFLECGRFANAVGAFCVSSVGATTGIRPFAQIQKFLEKNK